MKRHPLRSSLVPLLFWLCLGWNTPVRAETVHLTVSVTDEQGNKVSGARVNVYQYEATRSRRFDVPIPADYQGDTNAEGLARIQMNVPTGKDLDIAVEVSAENMEAQTHRLNLGQKFPTRLPLEKFVLKKRSAAGEGPIINVIVEVQDLEGNALEGASVLIRDPSLGAVTGRFPGTTGVDGRARIPVLYGSADSTERLSAQVSKQGYKDKSISIELTTKQVGKTAVGGTARLEKASTSGIRVTVSVHDSKNNNQGIGDAKVVFDGAKFYTDTTNGSGDAVFYVEPGTYGVRISQDNFRSASGEVTILKDEKEKTVNYALEKKSTKDEAEDIIEVTVLKKDPTDENSGPTPLEGAVVRAGGATGYTNAEGVARLHGAFEEKQQVSVEASGYTSKSTVVAVAKILHYSAGKGSTTLVLDPELSEKSPIRIIVAVEDLAGNKIEGATVEFHSVKGDQIGGGTTKGGVVDFKSSDKPKIPIDELRKGITVNVKKAPEFKEVINRSVPSNLLQPSLQAGTYLVQLDRDWTELEKALGELEAKAAALKNEAADAGAKAKTADSLIAKFPAAKGRVQEMLNELQQAEAAFKREESKKGCEEVKTLVKQITDAQADAERKEAEIRKGLDEATALSGTCKSKADADTIKKHYGEAIKAAGEISKLTKNVAEPHQKLSRLAASMNQGGALKKQIQEKLQQIENEVEAAKKDSTEANVAFNQATAGALGITGKRAALVSELDKIITKFDLAKNDKLVPPELKGRFNNLSQLLNSITAPKAPGVERLDEVMKPILAQLDLSLIQARGTARQFDEALCEVTPMDDAVEEINSHVSGATIELSAAADLPAKADECIAKASQSPTPASDEVIVPDISGFAEPSAMKAGAGPNMIGAIVATKATPPPGTTKLFAYQDPPAGSKAKRGSTLKIFIYQSLTVVASPTPTPSPAIDEVVVPDISRANGSDVKAMKAAAGPDMVGIIAATSATPPPGTTTLFAGQDPVAGSRAKRGSTLKIFVYQSLALAATPTPSASPTPIPPASPSATVAAGIMPNLIGLTLELAVGRLPAGMRIGSYTGGDKPSTPALANTVYSQAPAAGTKIDLRNPPVVSVKVYGAANSMVGNGPERFDGSYTGSYTGADKGTVRFTVANGVIAITSPGRGTGQISQSGSASISGSGADGNSTYSFTGTFSIGSGGKASASGTWSGKQYGYQGTGTWSASRR